MKYRDFGKLGMKGSAFGLGCMRFNGEASGDTIINEEVIYECECIGSVRKCC